MSASKFREIAAVVNLIEEPDDDKTMYAQALDQYGRNFDDAF